MPQTFLGNPHIPPPIVCSCCLNVNLLWLPNLYLQPDIDVKHKICNFQRSSISVATGRNVLNATEMEKVGEIILSRGKGGVRVRPEERRPGKCPDSFQKGTSFLLWSCRPYKLPTIWRQNASTFLHFPLEYFPSATTTYNYKTRPDSS